MVYVCKPIWIINFLCFQVMKISKEHGLYDAIIYIYNNGMLDYVTPAEELLNILMNAMDSSKDYSTNSHHHLHNGLSSYESVTKRMTSSQIKLGNKLLVYISCCLAGILKICCNKIIFLIG